MTRRSRSRSHVRSLAVATALAALPYAAAAAQPYTSVTIFGDSYSDTGNASILSAAFGYPNPTPPPYFPGHFSNGPVWVEYLTTSLGRPGDAAPVFLAGAASGNYAIGGARSGTAPGPIPIPSTAAQIAQYQGYLSGHGLTFDPTGLYVLFSGGNDMRDVGLLTDPLQQQAATLAAANRVGDQLTALVAAGARNILIPYLGDVGNFPEALGDPTRSAALHQLTPLFNQTLGGRLAALRALSPSTSFFDLRLDNVYINILNDAANGGARYGITNVTTPCFAPGAPSCAVSLFVDGQHPTTLGHQIIAGAAYTYLTTGVNVSAVPEPATVGLVGAGLLLVGAGTARRRTRAA